MTQVRFDFLNFAPDIEDTENKGLTIADNCVHDTEGYKPIHLGSAGAFSTTGNLAGIVESIVTKSVGPGDDTFSAWFDNNSLQLNVGVNGITSPPVITGSSLSFSQTGTSQKITAFDVCESNGKIFFVVEVSQSLTSPNTTVSLRQIGYLDFLDLSVEFSPQRGSLTLTGFPPIVNINTSFLSPGVGTLSLSGFVPTVTIT